MLADTFKKKLGEIDLDNIELPIGYVDEDGNIHKRAKLQEVTGEVEEAYSDIKVRDNLAKMYTTLLNGVVVEIEGVKKVTPEVIRKMTITDREFLMVMSYLNSYGNILKWQEPCQVCKKQNSIEIDINNMEVTYLSPNAPRSFVTHLSKGVRFDDKLVTEVEVVLPNGSNQERIAPIVRSNPALAQTMLLQMITKRIGVYDRLPEDIFKKMSKKDRDYLARFIGDLGLGIDQNVYFSCNYCGAENNTVVHPLALLGE